MGALTKEQALALASARLRLQQPKDYKGLSSPGTYDPTQEMGFLEKFNAGIGKAFVDIGEGAAQLVGMGPNAEETRDRRQLDAPLMRTAGGITGNLSTLIPAAVIPGANTVAGAGALGATMSALQPAEGAGERIMNMGIGGALGAGVQTVAGPGARILGERAAAREAQASTRQTQNATRDATLRDAQDAGYVVPPSAVNPSTVNKILESISGKAAIGQEASVRNQEVTNRLAREALGFPEGTPLSESALRAYRERVSQPYREVSSLSPHAQNLLEQLKQARADATAHFRHYERSADPSALKQAMANRQAAEIAENILEVEARQANRPELVAALRDARKHIAMSHDIEKALNVATGDVSARQLGRALDRGKPLTGELATAARFGEAFSPYARDAASIPTPGVSKVGALASALMGGGGAMAAGPAGAAAGALPFVAPPMARSLALSRPYQSRMAQPDYSVGPVTRGMAPLADEETRRRIALLARSLSLPMIPTATSQ